MASRTCIELLFVITTSVAVSIAVQAARQHRSRVILALFGWAVLQIIVARSGFYAGAPALPPRFILAVAPPFLVLAGLFSVRAGRTWLGNLDPSALLLLHTVRIPVEAVLHQLYLEGSIPQVMTWEGRNFDLFTGVSALFLYAWSRRSGALPRGLLIVWNVVGLLLVFSVLIHGALSAPSPFQQFVARDGSFALLEVPFVWLPSLIVPIVVIAHAASLLQLLGVRSAHSASSSP